MKRIFFILVIAILLANCSPINVGGQMSVAQSSKSRNTPVSNAESQARLVAGTNAFAIDLYRVLSSQSGNLFLSPYSISSALAMTQAGARGNTLTQMEKGLHFDLPGESLHASFSALQLALNRREQNAQDANKKDFRLRVINAIWGEKTYSFKIDYLDLLAENYGAGMRLLDFKSSPEPSRGTINQWVSDQTEQKVKELLAPGTISPLTRLVLTNAIYFNANWRKPFPVANTKTSNFTLLDGKRVAVAMMATSSQLNYVKGAGFQVVELPYESDKLSMMVVVPDEGRFSEIEKIWDADQLNSIQKGFITAQVNLTFPKFRIESSFGLVDTLVSLGMKDAFKINLADFSGMDGTHDLYISAVEHKAYVSVDEKGTEAAAATGVVMELVSMPVLTVDLKIDRPFIFFILDKQSGIVLFMGRLTNPT